MSPQPSTIVLNESQHISVTYDPSTTAVTANLPQPTPIEKVLNKQKLMLLIYFAQREQQQRNTPRKINVQVSLEFNIVEQILLHFNSLRQAKRTVHEYAEVGDRTDASKGMAVGAANKKSLVITQEIKTIILDWMNDVLSKKDQQTGPSAAETPAPAADSKPTRKRKRRASVNKNASPTAETISSEDFQSIPPLPPHAQVKKQRRQSKLAANDPSILTPGPAPSSLPAHESSRPSTADMSSDHIQRFMSSPAPHAISTAPTSAPSTLRNKASNNSDGAASEGSKSDDTSDEGSDHPKNSSDDGTDPLPPSLANVDSPTAENNDDEKSESSGTSEDEIREFVSKVKDYAILLYRNSREGQEAKVRKYTRKLKRLAKRFGKRDDLSH